MPQASSERQADTRHTRQAIGLNLKRESSVILFIQSYYAYLLFKFAVFLIFMDTGDRAWGKSNDEHPEKQDIPNQKGPRRSN